MSKLTDVPVSNSTTVGIAERNLQGYVCQKLSQARIDYKTEVIYPGTDKKADIVTTDAVIEIKRYLTCDSIRQAYSHAKVYRGLLEKPHIAIIGFSHPDPTVTKEALALKAEMESEILTVVFIERDLECFLKLALSSLRKPPQHGDISLRKFNPFSWGRIFFVCLTLIGITIVLDKSPEKQWQYYNNAFRAVNFGKYDDAATNFAGLKSATEGPCIRKYAAAMENASRQAKDAVTQGRGSAVASQIFSFYKEKAVRDFTVSKCKMPKLGE